LNQYTAGRHTAADIDHGIGPGTGIDIVDHALHAMDSPHYLNSLRGKFGEHFPKIERLVSPILKIACQGTINAVNSSKDSLNYAMNNNERGDDDRQRKDTGAALNS
jgi:hypothetical protein